ncbi:hypothetical protein, partial [Acetonema longum]
DTETANQPLANNFDKDAVAERLEVHEMIFDGVVDLVKTEVEKKRIADEQEAARKKAEDEAAKKKAEEEEAARKEKARIEAEKAEADRLAAEEAKKSAEVAYNPDGNVTIRDAWLPTDPIYTNSEGNRSRENYILGIEQFNVTSNDRYTPYKLGKGDTYCNIYVSDVTQAMGAPIPHWVNQDLEPQFMPIGLNSDERIEWMEARDELNAYGVINWLQVKGPANGWQRVDGMTAQDRANKGYPTVATSPGHVMIVRPAKVEDTYVSIWGPTIAQAGKTNSNYCWVRDKVNQEDFKWAEYWTHN